jgi:hypothetical protein
MLVASAEGECIPNSTFGTIRISTDSSEQPDSKQDADLEQFRRLMWETCANLEMYFGERNEFQVSARDASSKQMLPALVRLRDARASPNDPCLSRNRWSDAMAICCI